MDNKIIIGDYICFEDICGVRVTTIDNYNSPYMDAGKIITFRHCTVEDAAEYVKNYMIKWGFKNGR